MWETSFQHASSTPLPPNVSIETGLQLLHDFDFVLRLSPDCRGCRPIPPPQPTNGERKKASGNASNAASDKVRYFEVEDDLPFIPKRLWNGGVKYQADFLPTPDGCDITVHAPGGFTSTNHWRLLRENVPEGGQASLDQIKSKDLDHAASSGSGGWYVQISSDAKVEKVFASFVKGFIRNSHQQLQLAFIERLNATPSHQRSRRPGPGRRNSSVL